MKFTERILKNAFLTKSDIESYFDAIAVAQETVDCCSYMIEMQNKFVWQDLYLLNFLLMNLKQINQRINLKKLLECIDDPIEQINANLANIKDDFDCKLLNSTLKSQLIGPNIKKNRNSMLNIFWTIYRARVAIGSERKHQFWFRSDGFKNSKRKSDGSPIA